MVNFDTKILSNGKKVVMPLPEEKDIPMGFARKLRHLKPAQQEEEMMWLIWEYFLSEENMEVLDSMTSEDWDEYNKLSDEDEVNSKK